MKCTTIKNLKNLKKCFIIMPISTPESWVPKYSGDKDHFIHVLNYLLIPAIEKAGFEHISPITKGSELIHGEIIRNIESADFVLCDISILNPNVFLELGIRTSLNKPVCIIRDDLTKTAPFDLNMVNNKEYLSTLHVWEREDQLEKLASHIKDSFDICQGSNALWKYFGLSSSAQPIKEESPDAKIDFLIKQVGVLREQLSVSSKVSVHTKLNENMIDDYIFKLKDVSDRLSVGLDKLGFDNPSAIEFHTSLILLFESLDQLEIIIKNSGLPLEEVSTCLEFLRDIYKCDPR